MQFAGQRTTLDLEPIGEPVNILIKLHRDVLPDPGAALVTGITPQATHTDGVTEAEFLQYFYEHIVTGNTTFLGYNTVRFDDEFMRYLHYRNYYDPYQWQWADGCSRWDILDAVRMTRALRPQGINWPVTEEGKPTNRLELITKLNNLAHEQAHDALSDVYATIAVAKLIKQAQPELYNYLYNSRKKTEVSKVITSGQPFVYTSGSIAGEFLHTSAVATVATHTGQDASIVFDLRHDPTKLAALTSEALAEAWRYKPNRDPAERLPLKTIKHNRCPAVAPLGVIKDSNVQKNIHIDLQLVSTHFNLVKQHSEKLAKTIAGALKILDEERDATINTAIRLQTVDEQLYQGFVPKEDTGVMRAIRAAEPDQITHIAEELQDERLRTLTPLYKARNYPSALSQEERQAYDDFVHAKLFAGGQSSKLAQYFAAIQEQSTQSQDSPDAQFVLQELQLYGESVMPSDMSQD